MEGVAQSNIVLRDLTLISDRTIDSFSQESVRLSDDSELSWDQILRGQVKPEQQAEFDRNVREIGLPLFRLQKRIQVGDWARLNEITENLMIRYSGIDSETAKSVCLATAKGKLESGRRVEAVLPFLMACGKSATLSLPEIEALGFTKQDFQDGVASQLLPVWFDIERVRAQKKLLESYAFELGPDFPPGGKVYLASFCLSLGQFEKGKKYAGEIESDSELVQQWKALLLSEIDRRTRADANGLNLFQVNEGTTVGPQAASAFFDALALDTAKADTKPFPQILEYLKVAALWEEQFPNLSSAAIYRAIELAEAANLSEEAKSMTGELLRSFAKSYHGRLMAARNIGRR
jgi:hypothetical protein